MNLIDDNISNLCKNLSNNTHLKVINLSENEFRDKSVEYLLELLEKNKNIQKININNRYLNREIKIKFYNKITENVKKFSN